MLAHNDFEYVKYILNADFEDAFELYKKILDNIKTQNLERLKDRYWHLWLFELKNGSKELDFQKYFDKRTNVKNKLDSVTRKNEESRILEKYKNIGGLDNDSNKIRDKTNLTNN